MCQYSYWEIVDACDRLPNSSAQGQATVLTDYYTLTWNDTAIGYVPNQVVTALSLLPDKLCESAKIIVDHIQRKLSLFNGIPTYEARSAAAATICEYWRAHRTFKILDGWRSELFPVYGPGNKPLWGMERCATYLFGVVTYGVHLTAYMRDNEAPYGLKFWVQKRSANKQTFAGMLDNTVAGGMAAGEIPLDCVVREAEEEAGIEKELVRKRVKACGSVTYIYVRDSRAGGETGLIQPECEYIYDLELPGHVVPTPVDGEAEEFYLWTSDEVQAALSRGEFKPNSAIVMLDFFIRWGILTAENEKDFVEIQSRIHRELDFPGPHLLL